MDTEALPNGCDRSHIRNGVPSLAETGYRAKLPCRVRDESQTLAQDSRLWVTSSHYSRRKPGPGDTLAIARNLALAAETVHRARHAIGDVNEKNVMVRDGLQAVLPSARPHYRHHHGHGTAHSLLAIEKAPVGPGPQASGQVDTNGRRIPRPVRPP